jgi:hypothetical protein
VLARQCGLTFRQVDRALWIGDAGQASPGTSLSQEDVWEKPVGSLPGHGCEERCAQDREQVAVVLRWKKSPRCRLSATPVICPYPLGRPIPARVRARTCCRTASRRGPAGAAQEVPARPGRRDRRFRRGPRRAGVLFPACLETQAWPASSPHCVHKLPIDASAAGRVSQVPEALCAGTLGRRCGRSRLREPGLSPLPGGVSTHW